MYFIYLYMLYNIWKNILYFFNFWRGNSTDMKSWSLFTMTAWVDSLFLWIFSGNSSFIKIARSQTEWSCCSSRSYVPVSSKLRFISSWKWSRMENIQVLFCNAYQGQATLNRPLLSDTSDTCKSCFSSAKLSPDSSFL